jgi:uncharacterized membrane protein
MPDTSPDDAGRTRSERVHTALTMVLAVALLISIGAVGVLVLSSPATTGPYTELYVLGPEGNAGGYPQVLTPDESASIIVGVSNHEHRTMTYRLQVAWNDSVTQTQEWRVDDGATVERPVTVTAPTDPRRYHLRVLLYRPGSPDEPYRSLRLFVTVQPAR